MRHNPARRAALLDAAIEVLARDGSRGLTFRAVDAAAKVPNGTASNYFANRDDLLTQVGGRVYERLRPDEATVANASKGPRDRSKVAALMRDVVERIFAFPTGFLALLELRLESTRRPALRDVLTRQIREDLDGNIDFHLKSNLPGDATGVVLLYLGLNWLILDRLTLPDVIPEAEIPALVDELVERLLASSTEKS